MGIRIARKHVGWFFDAIEAELPVAVNGWKRQFNALEATETQQALLQNLERQCCDGRSTLRDDELAA